jgi:hypothetical protein
VIDGVLLVVDVNRRWESGDVSYRLQSTATNHMQEVFRVFPASITSPTPKTTLLNRDIKVQCHGQEVIQRKIHLLTFYITKKVPGIPSLLSSTWEIDYQIYSEE